VDVDLDRERISLSLRLGDEVGAGDAKRSGDGARSGDGGKRRERSGPGRDGDRGGQRRSGKARNEAPTGIMADAMRRAGLIE
jgi:uncharacterized protein